MWALQVAITLDTSEGHAHIRMFSRIVSHPKIHTEYVYVQVYGCFKYHCIRGNASGSLSSIFSLRLML